MTDLRPLLALEEPADFPGQERSYRYLIVDAARNRPVGTLFREFDGRRRERWRWAVTVPAAEGVGSLPPAGAASSRDAALADLKAAWLTYHDHQDWPPRQSVAWQQGSWGMGPYQDGRMPRGWQPA